MRENQLGIPMIPESLRKKLFPNKDNSVSKIRAIKTKNDLKERELLTTLELEEIPDFDIPDLISEDLESHFNEMAREISEPYYSLCHELLRSEIPEKPKEWEKVQGWVRYEPNKEPESVPYPLEGCMVFDVETIVRAGNVPIMAIAVTPCAWYFWLSRMMFRGSPELIPLGNNYRFIVAHNSSFDRSKVVEEYSLKDSKLKFWDTQSTHIVISGFSNNQTKLYKKNKKEELNFQPAWLDTGTTNSLADLAKFYLGQEMSKEERNVFVTGGLQEIEEKFYSLAKYNAKDVEITFKVFKKIFPRFKLHCPSMVTFSGMLEIGKSILPTDLNKWFNYVNSSNAVAMETEAKIQKILVELTDELLEEFDKGKDFSDDIWLNNLDWNLPSSRARKMVDKPMWYRDLFKKGEINLTLKTLVTPYLLRLKWLGYPLYYHNVAKGENPLPPYPSEKLGWGFIVPEKDLEEFSNKTKYQIKGKEGYFIKIPHKDGEKANVGSPFAKDYISSMEDEVLTSEHPKALKLIKMTSSLTYWTSIKTRVDSQFLWKNEKGETFLIPVLLPSGTVTRRSRDSLWLTASNPKENRIGSELKTIVTIPKDYLRVGSDVDSQELWISDLLGDSEVGIIGGSPSSYQTLMGSSSNKSDMHSKFSMRYGISRDSAKQINYARRYGSGLNATASYFRQADKSLTDKEAKRIAKESINETKGIKRRGGYSGGLESHLFNALEKIAKSNNPRTPVLNCSISEALKPSNVGGDFLPSRINWVD